LDLLSLFVIAARGCIAMADITQSLWARLRGGLRGEIAIGFVISPFDFNRWSFFISQVRRQVVNMRVNNPVRTAGSQTQVSVNAKVAECLPPNWAICV